MISIDNPELFDKYYQKEYDFDTSSLSMEEINDIKKCSREKRVDYGQAPMGSGAFDWIINQEPNLRFELVKLSSTKIDALLYIPRVGKDCAYIVLNANKPLANQIFAAVHEYYHYICDYQQLKSKTFICDFSSLKDTNEKKASRFAAEILLPEEALFREIREYLGTENVDKVRHLNTNQFAALSIYLTVKYQIPLKAVIYRFIEEGIIPNEKNYIENYEFINRALINISIFSKRIEELYSINNEYLTVDEATYNNMEVVFNSGRASKTEIIGDANVLGLNLDIVNSFMPNPNEDDEDEDDDIDDGVITLIQSHGGRN